MRRDYKVLVVHFPHLTLADVTRDVARRAARLRARYHLRPADALQVATALVHGATAFVTTLCYGKVVQDDDVQQRHQWPSSSWKTSFSAR